jgi:hypothetical protein
MVVMNYSRWMPLVLLVAGFGQGVWAADLSPEDRLKAIRSALVETAMKANTQVTATSWMETNGALRELNRFSSEIKVRDLRVKSYSRDANNEPQAEMGDTNAEPMAAKRCEATQAKAPLRHVMSIGMDLSPSLRPAQRLQAQHIGFTARARLLEAASQAQQWRVMTDAVHNRTYDRLMYGQGEEHVQWHLQLTMASAPQGTTTDDLSGFVLQWQVRGPGARGTWLSAQDTVLTYPQSDRFGQAKVDLDTADAIARSVASLAQKLDQQLACDPQSFVVLQDEPGKLTLNAGVTSGLRVGDKLMLADSRVLPKHALEGGALDAAVLAEVKSLSPYQAELKQVAGQSKKFSGTWVAWPYTY